MKKKDEFNVTVEADVHTTTDVNIDVWEIMNDLSDEAFEEYCDERNSVSKLYDIKRMTEAYFHGDIDLHSFFKKLGKRTVQKILEEI